MSDPTDPRPTDNKQVRRRTIQAWFTDGATEFLPETRVLTDEVLERVRRNVRETRRGIRQTLPISDRSHADKSLEELRAALDAEEEEADGNMGG